MDDRLGYAEGVDPTLNGLQYTLHNFLRWLFGVPNDIATSHQGTDPRHQGIANDVRICLAEHDSFAITRFFPEAIDAHGKDSVIHLIGGPRLAQFVQDGPYLSNTLRIRWLLEGGGDLLGRHRLVDQEGPSLKVKAQLQPKDGVAPSFQANSQEVDVEALLGQGGHGYHQDEKDREDTAKANPTHGSHPLACP